MKKKLENKLKKNVILQYIILMVFSIILIIYPLICILMIDTLEPGAHADGWLIIAWIILGSLSFYTVPIGGIVVILSTIAFRYNKKSKWKNAFVLNLICTIIMIVVALVSSLFRMLPVASVLWIGIGFNIYLLERADNLQKEKQIITQNNED